MKHLSQDMLPPEGGGLARLIAVEARLDAVLEGREAEAAALVAAAREECDRRLAGLPAELDAWARERERALATETAARLAEIEGEAARRLARLEQFPAATRSRIVSTVVEAVLQDMHGVPSP